VEYNVGCLWRRVAIEAPSLFIFYGFHLINHNEINNFLLKCDDIELFVGPI